MAQDIKTAKTQLLLHRIFSYYAIPLTIMLLTTAAHSHEIDLAIYVSDYAGSEGQYVYITNNQKNADERWYIVPTCPTKPDVAVYISHMPVAMEQYIFISTTTSHADKFVCITNLNDLNDETLRLLKIIDAAQQ
tara:strand:+ start:56 stop:457 length:402 start_codon:yes stop_codon:yes gene_type:complete